MIGVLSVWRREVREWGDHLLPAASVSVFLLGVGAATLWYDDLLLTGRSDLRGALHWMSAALVLWVPALTMRSLSEELRPEGPLQALPLSSGEVAIGKWLGAVSLIAVGLALTAGWPLSLAWWGELDWGPVAGGYLGLLLEGGALAAIGLAASASTRSGALAWLLTLAVGAVPWVGGLALGRLPEAWVPLAQYATFEWHAANLAAGALDSRSVIFFGGLTILSLRLSATLLEHRRLW
ncbi:MAG: hypothetical protein JXX28_13295 [Deltaproteobacteria bacterium]|nr:hypothetical protein [Deltaproteobacteria bacterium]